MSRRHPGSAERASAEGGARRLTRSIAATWWYTVSGVLFLEAMLIFMWTGSSVQVAPDAALLTGFGGILWWASTVPLLAEYRRRLEDGPVARWRTLIPLVVAAAYGAAVGATMGMWTAAALPLLQTLALLNWPRGVRVRLVVVATVVLAGVWVVDARDGFPGGFGSSWWLLGVYSIGLPALTVFSLWWWDVLIALDRARASEARLAATQERLRIATDVHDLQGHHLQVIALQLELAERLMPTDPAAALEQLRGARASVQEAQQGTRDLATRVRSVPLQDEMANAVDLLRAAGAEVEALVHPDAEHAPTAVLGPVVRETTTNVLRHGAGGRVRLSLEHADDSWRYTISNDTAPGTEPVASDGSGLEGIRRRVAAVGGTVDVERADGSFTVSATVPSAPGEAA